MSHLPQPDLPSATALFAQRILRSLRTPSADTWALVAPETLRLSDAPPCFDSVDADGADHADDAGPEAGMRAKAAVGADPTPERERAEERAFDPSIEDWLPPDAATDAHMRAAMARLSPTRRRVRPAVLRAATAIAALFEAEDRMLACLAMPGALTAIATRDPALTTLTFKILTHLCRTGALPDGVIEPLILRADDALRSKSRTSRAAEDDVLGALDARLRIAIEQRRAIVLVATDRTGIPDALKPLPMRWLTLPAVTQESLRQIIAAAYPGRGEAISALPSFPGNTELARLGVDDLTLALRAGEPDEALHLLQNTLTPPPPVGAGLAEFPLADDVRAAVEQLVADLRDWRAGALPWRDVTRGLLFAGPSGCGKTELARLLAQEAGVSLVVGSLATWQSGGDRSGELVRAMKATFAEASAKAPCLVFIDELDAFGDRNRRDHNSGWTDFVVGALLECLDGYTRQDGVVAIAATNHLARIDPALRRPGRFDRILHLSHPDIDQLPRALRWHLANDLAAEDLAPLVLLAIGMSGAGIAAAVRMARATARRNRRELDIGDLDAVLRAERPQLPAQAERIVAIHEAGHAIVAAATGAGTPDLVALLPTGGMARQLQQPDSGSRAEIEAALAILIAGRAAERLLLGDVSAGAGGPAQSDLARATAIAAALEVSLGLGDRAIWLAAPEEVLPLLRNDCGLRIRVERHLRRAEERATAILGANRIVLERLAGKLQAQRIVARAELDALLAGVRAPANAASSGPAASTQSEHDLSARPEPEPPGTGNGPATVAPE